MEPYKTDCFYYTEVHDMGACISQCTRYRQLGKCPCDNCTDYISKKEVHLVLQDYMRNKQQPKAAHWISIDTTHSQCDKCLAVFEIVSANGEANFCPNCGARMGVEKV